MTARDEFENACREWRRLAAAQGEAIQARNWPLVAGCQKALGRVQLDLGASIERARSERAGARADGAVEKHFRALLADLLQLGRHNQALLEAAGAAARTRLADLQQAGRVLRRIRQSYSPAAPPAWNLSS